MSRRAVFKWELTVSGIPISSFSDIKISYSTANMGLSGIATSTMEFKSRCPEDAYESIWQYGAPVELSCTNDLSVKIPTFYVKSKSYDNGFVSWVCADRMSRTDVLVEFSDTDFEDDKISALTLINKAAGAAGFTAGFGGDSLPLVSAMDDIKKETAEDKTAREILEMFASAMCGYWIDGGEHYIIFVPFGTEQSVIADVKYSPLKNGGRIKYTKLIMYNGDETYTAGSGSAESTLMISTPLASQSLCSAVLGQIHDFEYRAWNCEKGLSWGYIYPGSIAFSDDDRRIFNNVTMYPSANGIFFEASASAVPETDSAYQTQVKRQLNHKLEIGQRYGDTAYGKDGIRSFQNLNSGDEDSRKETTVMTFFESEV